jgi:hypothetical protein
MSLEEWRRKIIEQQQRGAELQHRHEQLKDEKEKCLDQCKKGLENLHTIQQESERVIHVARTAHQILDDLDAEFERRTSLNRLDMAFLFLSIALQCVRQYVLSNDAFRLTSQEGDKLASKIVPKDWQEVLLASVPYDAIQKNNPEEDTGLGGSTHRYRTLGHDPVLGWVFGTMNILSDSLTKTDFITSYSVKNMIICEQIPTPTVFSNGVEQIQADKYLLPIAVTRQAIHFGTDHFTKYGLPLPFISSVDNAISKTLITQFNIDMYSVTRGATVAILINALISCIHQLFYDKTEHKSRKLYEVKTRKILSYSNLIASASNVIKVAVSCSLGDISALKQLDVGGILVTLYNLISYPPFIGEVKREFIMESFNEMIRGEEYDF